MQDEINIGAELHAQQEPSLRDVPLTLANLPRLPFLALIRLYQLIISPALPAGTCRFTPTCSHYSYEAIAKHGAIKGLGLSIWRVLRCQPFSHGGYDPVP
ncbi:MAG: membrane protein insertion efficiency factor YidD [Anaerolineales bacterium]|nr:membrane protein insertion efficiency factor YidD [Anaerolineales bacterium]